MKRNMKKTTLVLALAALLGLGACSTTKKLEGNIAIDGSSTVYPVTEAVAEEFNVTYPDVKVSVGFSGTGGGMSKFIAKEIDIADASRKIKSSEAEAATAAGIEFLEIKVGFDGLSVLVNPENTWVTSLTVEQLQEMWKPGSTIMNWSDIDPTWPNEKIVFYAPGVDSGTFDYFTEEIVGELDAMRSDYTGSEDDNVLVQGIAGDKYAIGFFGFAYYEENKDKLKVIGVDEGEGAVVPSFETIADGSYSPLSRPLYIYVNKASLEREEVLEFVTFYLENAKELVADVGYVPLPDADYEASLELLK
ncbi:MAG: phosphate ABC transporter substrate-binding protein [Firmicutes bacterium GWF2_51_9]|nr:PstS family phosphate ABC transporter substrate-binding protein [Erysipelotrichaceae bacterium]OGS54063.1 MAG: phosphate ABC transporter substrate-binding protein [Firmicutes bacterium GWF2_51_9]OGS59376.1 MAG: phosphate ABC transporter substrate-binding protein [Firmicutes bacterium GWE2_51_13]HAM62339.1 phosphate ABC transporter substrate-binding protein [Erysipelotrichaceae bacterium]HAO61131.1 phosphate ABC transporter substrate-binding protein [Erysipelotrichaceae bacterium]